MKADMYGKLMGCMRENWLYLFSLHKHLVCQSESYPKIGIDDVRELFIESEVAQSSESNDFGKFKRLSDDEVVKLFTDSLSPIEKVEIGEGDEDGELDE